MERVLFATDPGINFPFKIRPNRPVLIFTLVYGAKSSISYFSLCIEIVSCLYELVIGESFYSTVGVSFLKILRQH